MGGIGEKLTSARESRKLSIKDISRELNISSKYLTALENEQFDEIPGETYVVGFLRSYSEFLKLDSDEIIEYYKGFKIGESTTPLEELMKPTAPILIANLSNLFNKYRKIIYISGGTIFLILIIWAFGSIFSTGIDVESDDSVMSIKDKYSASKNSAEIDNIRNLQLANERAYVLAYKNETIQFLVDNKELMFLVRDIKNNSVILEFLPGNHFETIEMEKPNILKIEGYSRDIVLTLKGLTENRAKIFVMLGKKSETEPRKVEEESYAIKGASEGRVIAKNWKNLKIVFEAEFIQKTYLELYLDGMQKKRGLIPAGVRERWEASEYIQLKIGNAGGLRARINGEVYTFGLPGQVANKVVTWKKDVKNPNLYYIVVKDW